MKFATLTALSSSALLLATLSAAPASAATLAPLHPVAGSSHSSHATQPQRPTGVRVPALAVDESSVSLVWNKPEAYQDIVDYHVYQDGRLIGSASTNSTSPALPYIDKFYADPSNAEQVKAVMNNFTATNLKPDTRYTFTVRSVASDGTESKDSPPLHQMTTPTAKVVNIEDFGAVGDGTTLNTAAIQKAIDAAPKNATVLVPKGTFKTGAIWLKSDMTLEVAKDATLLGSENADDYPYHYRLYKYSTDERFYALINAQSFDGSQLKNIRIVGEGTIDGNGWKQAGHDADGFPISTKSSSSTVDANGILAAAQNKRAAELGSPKPYPTRSNLITLRGVDNVYYSGFTALNPSNHTLVNLENNNVTVNGVKLLTFDNNNADGIEFAHGDGLTVYNTLFDTGDDAMNFAAGLGQQSVDEPSTRNAWIFNNYFRKGHGAVVTGSHTGAIIENITAEDNVMNKTDIGLRMKTSPANGGGARHIVFRDNAMKDLAKQAFIFTSSYSDANAAISVEPAKVAAYFRDITVENVTVDGVGKAAIEVTGVEGQPHRDIHFTNVRFLRGTPTKISHLADSSFNDVVFDDVAEPWVISDSTGLSFTGTTTQTDVSRDAAQAPSWPHNASVKSSSSADGTQLTWPAATDNVKVAEYRVYLDDRLVATVPGTETSARLQGLAPKLTYRGEVRAYDATGNRDGALKVGFKTPGAKDTTAPTVPQATDAITVRPVSGAVGSTWASIQWQPADDDSGVYSYIITVNGKSVQTVPGDQLSATVGGLAPDAESVIGITAVDATGNRTAYPATLTVTTTPNPPTPGDPRG